MKPEIKAKWLTALRSGEYKQGQNFLHARSDNSWCCLGVLCDLHKKETGSQWLDEEYVRGGYDDMLPAEVQEWSGVDDIGLFYGTKGTSHSLSGINDSSHDFKDVINAIETYF